jgi:hypothetical protein
VLVAIGGVSGTGKTTVARALAPDLPPVPGAVHLRSDEIRKALLGVEPLAPLPAEGYRPEVTAQVYDRLLADARACLGAGQSVILDATFLDPAEREAARALAAELRCRAGFVWLTAPPATLLARVAARRGDASDADVGVVRAQLARDPGPLDWWSVPADGAPEDTAARIRDQVTAD